MDLLTTSVFRARGQICSIQSSERSFNLTPIICTSCTFSSSLSLSALSPLKYSKKWKISRTRHDAMLRLRASQSAPNEPNNPDNEEFSIEEGVTSSDIDTQNYLPLSPTTNAGNQLNQEQLQEVLNTLSHSLAVLSSALSEVSSAVRVLSASLSTEQLQPNALVSVSEANETRNEAVGSEDPFSNPPEPWDISTMPTVPTRNVDEIVDGNTDANRSVPQHLVEQNRVAHRLAYSLQQSFRQARTDGLGKPFEVAVEEFADTCIEAHQKGIGLKELQLQLILQDGSLRGAFAIRNQRFSNDPIFDEDSRIRSLWVRLVYSTLAEVEEMDKPTQTKESTDENQAAEMDGTETFVKEVIKTCFEQGYDLARIKLEQNFAGEVTSPSIKAMRQNHYLVLLVVDKVQKLKRDVNSTDEKQDGNSIDEAS